MATKLPRITIVITPELHAALKELRSVSGVSSSGFISNILSEAVPMIHSVTKSFKLAKSGVKAPLEPMKQVLETAMMDAAQIRMDLDKPMAKKKLRKTAGQKK